MTGCQRSLFPSQQAQSRLEQAQADRDETRGLLQDAEARYVVLSHEATVVHDEHAPLHIPAATYEVRLQREYAPAAPNLWVDASD